MVTPASRMRRELAERIAGAYVAVGAEGVLLGGSTARGDADAYSDIELGVFWSRAPTVRQRENAIALAGGDLQRLWPYADAERAWYDDWSVGHRGGAPNSGVAVEPVHMTIEDAETTVDDVVVRFDAGLEKHVLLAALTEGIVLAGEEVLTPWMQAAAAYPDPLASAVVERHAQIDHFWRFAMFRDRDNPLQAAQMTADVQSRVLHALHAVNRVYWFGFKSLDSISRRFALEPANLVARIRGAYGLDLDERADALAALVEETYDLVERYVPAVDVERLRAIFRFRRPLWEDDPPG